MFTLFKLLPLSTSGLWAWVLRFEEDIRLNTGNWHVIVVKGVGNGMVFPLWVGYGEPKIRSPRWKMMRQKEKKRKGELTGGMTPGRVTCFMRTNLPSLMGHVRLSWPAFSQISSRFCNSLMYPYFISTLTYAPAPISAEVVPVAQIVRLWPLGGWGGLLAS